MRSLIHIVAVASLIYVAQCQETPQQFVAGCFDSNMNCGFWGSKGECTANPNWMLPNCRLTCNQCRPPPPSPQPLQPQVRDSAATGSLSNALGAGGMTPQSTCGGRVQTVEIATRIVPTGKEFRDRAFRTGCAIPNQPNICSQNACYHERYRTFDGSCNNPDRTMKGSSYTPYARVLEANYEDGKDRMIGSSPGQRPNPRDVTHLLLSTRVAIPTPLNGLLMMFGQFFSHDVTRIAMINMCTCATSAPQCANMPIPRHDTKRGQCIPFTRTIPLCGTGPTGRLERTQVNENTAFIDGSMIYASDPRTAADLRVGAQIRTSAGRFMFPPRSGADNIMVGDSRANLFIGLAAMHTLFVRLHNKIARTFPQMNPHWSDDRVYQETRKIVGAIMQVITYQEFMPMLLGESITSQLMPEYTGFKPDVEPAISVEFAGAAFRLHGMIREFYRLVNESFQPIGDIRFVDATGKVQELLNTGTDPLVRGMITVASKKPQRISTQVTEELFGLSDMSSLNIQRGRDLGLMNYDAYRRFCRLKPLTSFDDWPEVANAEVRRRVADLYGDDPARLDLYVGGLLEEPRDGSIVGPTFSCLIAEQMVRLRDGDRFFYRNSQQYSAAQTKALSRVTMAHVLCATGEKLDRVPRNAFLVDSGANVVPCNQIPSLDLTPWREAPPGKK